MSKVTFDPGLGFFMPWPVVLVSVADPAQERTNLITVGAVAPTCARPPTLGIAVTPVRYSYELIRGAREYVVNIPRAELAAAVDFCGSVSGRDVDKFRAAGLTPLPGRRVSCAVVAECPINLECRVTKVAELGSHDFFFGEIVTVQVSEDILNKKGELDPELFDLYVGVRGTYRKVGRGLGGYGFGSEKFA